MIARVELRRVATMWECSATFEVTGPHGGVMWEPLNIVVPLTAKPHCCYVNTVVFYCCDRVGVELGRCETLDLNTPSPTLVFLGGRWWEVSGGQVVQRDGRWCMERGLSSNSRMAIEANLGREGARQKALARSN